MKRDPNTGGKVRFLSARPEDEPPQSPGLGDEIVIRPDPNVPASAPVKMDCNLEWPSPPSVVLGTVRDLPKPRRIEGPLPDEEPGI